jgi:hypothetical protein|tara:strand:- start:3010 stop:5253 length:2244 start_codon:yes stop_codon:yes gene_type:complete
MMDEMAKYGRYGDTMLVHMNPVEVAGIASLVPGGKLTTNPVTGQPEAFLPILFGALGGALKLGTLGTAALTGVGTAAVTGDAKRGILAGLTAGASSKLGELFNRVMDAPMVAPGGITDVIPDAAKAGVDTAKASTDAVQAAAQSGEGVASVAQDLSQQSVIDPFPDMPASIAPKNMSPANIDLSSVPPPQPQNFSQKIFGGVEDAVSGGLDRLGPMGNLAVAGMGQGTIEQMRMEEQMRRQAEARMAEGEADRREAFDDLQRGYMAAQPGIPTGLSDARAEMSRRTPPPMYMEEGGSTKKKENGATRREDDNPYAQGSALGTARDVARFIGGPRGYFGVDPVTVQQRLRGPDTIAPPRDYMPGFEPEFSYFQDASEGISVPDRSYRPMRQGVISRGQYFDPILQAPQSNAQMNEYRRTLEQMDPGPLDIGSVMGLASEGSTLSTPQQNVFQAYYSQPPAPTPTTDTTPDTTPDSNTDGQYDALREYFPDMTDQEIQDYLDSLQSGNLFTLLSSVGDPNVMDAIAARDVTGPVDTTALTSPEVLIATYPGLTEGQALMIANMNRERLGRDPLDFQAGGLTPEVRLQTSLGETSVPSGGIAQVPTEFTAKNQIPSMDEVQMLSMAVLGQIENGDQIVEMFVQKYGPEIFRQAREMILQSVVPNAQTEGMIRGNGSGMDDAVQGMIGSEQPVAVSPGEFIVPADVVSGLGEGSSDAGAEKLDDMMDRVRMERNGTTKQAPQIDERKVMPA